jgi:DNA-binding transcriptional LysR family regulator
MCRYLRIQPSGFYAWQKSPLSTRAQEDARQTELIRQAWNDSGKVYGYRKLHDDLLDQGETCCPNRVARLTRLAGIKAQVGYKRRSGSLRGSLPLVAMLLSRVLADFMTAYPDIRLDLASNDRLVDMIDEGFDAVVRTGQPFDSRLMSRTLGHFRLKIVAAPSYLDRHGTPLTPVELRNHHCLRGRSPTTGKV